MAFTLQVLPKWYPGDWCDVVATAAGYAFVRMDGLDVVCVIDGVESWRLTASEPIQYLRAACNISTDEVQAIGYGTTTLTARHVTSSAETDLDTVYGQWPVALTYEGGDWTAYLVRSSLTYTRWPLAGVDPGEIPNPFVAGTNQGIVQIVSSLPVWREDEADPGHPLTTELSGVTFVYPMTVSGVTVGQSLGPPTNTRQIIAHHDLTELATVFPLEGFDPHVAVLADGSVAIACRTLAVPLGLPQNAGLMTIYGAAALALVPPWTAYDPLAAIDLPATYLPYQNPVVDRETGRITRPWLLYFQQLGLELSTPIGLDTMAISGGGGSTPVPPPPVVESADVLVGTNPSGFPDARLVRDTSSVRWNVSTPNVAEAHAVGVIGPPGRDGEDGEDGAFLGPSAVPLVYDQLTFQFVGTGASAIDTGIAGDMYVAYTSTIVSATLMGTSSGDLVVDIWKAPVGSFPPTVANTVTASALPTLSSSDISHDTTLTGWTRAITAGDVLRFNVDSSAGVREASIVLGVQRSA